MKTSSIGKRLLKTTSQALLANKVYDIEFHGYLSNHAKHAIVALDRLDASDARIQEYWDSYTHLTPYRLQLHPVTHDWDTVQPVPTEQEWIALRGKKQKWQEMVVFLQQQLDKKYDNDVNQLVKEYAPPLLSGMAGALTHGIIHLGWGIDAQSEWMILEGLAYLNFCYLGIDERKIQLHTERTKEDKSPMESLLRIASDYHSNNLQETWIQWSKGKYDESFHPELVPAGFQWQLAKVMKEVHPIATEIPSWLSNTNTLTDELFEQLYKAVILVYLATRNDKGDGNFVVLHAITSLWGLEETCRVVGNETVTRNALYQYFASLICLLSASTIGFPTVDVLNQVSVDYPLDHVDDEHYDWEPIVSKGIAEEEEHNIKLVYVTRELWNRYGHWTGFSEAAKAFTLTPNIGPVKSSFTS